MNITFLIGNGFDRNLGLNTAYSDFVSYYKGLDTTDETLKKFHEHIKENEELWSSAEVEIGEYTEEFEEGEGAAFCKCHKDFCENLAKYLEDESQKVDYQYISQDIGKAFSLMNSIGHPFPTEERETINAVISNCRSEATYFNFMVFNYTDTLDQCVSVIQGNKDVLGTHKYSTTIFNHAIGNIIHVHGTVDAQMVFGVNDESQISKPEIFSCENGDLYEQSLIKQQTNQGYLERTDAKSAKILDESKIIYIYGMSIGATDALWWERICQWLNGNSSRHLIVYRHSMPAMGLLAVDYKVEERKAKREITGFAKLRDEQKLDIEERIHITGENMFAALKDAAKKSKFAWKSTDSSTSEAHGDDAARAAALG